MPPLSDAEFHSYLNGQGQLTRPEELRLRIYHGGVEPSLRKVQHLRFTTVQIRKNPTAEVGKLGPRGHMWPRELFHPALHNNSSKIQMNKVVSLIGWTNLNNCPLLL